MNGWAAMFALLGGFVAVTALLGLLMWLLYYCLSRMGIGT